MTGILGINTPQALMPGHKNVKRKDGQSGFNALINGNGKKAEETVMQRENSAGEIDVKEQYERFVTEKFGAKASPVKPLYAVTEEQAAYFAGKYDLENMPQNSAEERAFLEELAAMNIIGEEDARFFNFNCAGSVESVNGSFTVTPFDGFSAAAPLWEDCNSDSDSIILRLMAIIDTQNNISRYYEEKCADKANVKACDIRGLSASSECLEGKQRVLDVLRKIAEY